MEKNYKNLIFTNHALERMSKRSISKDRIWEVVNHPSKVFDSNSNGSDKYSKKYIRRINDRNYHVVATYLPKENKQLVISVWVRGEDDKLGLVWTLITLPFKIIWWIFKKIFVKK